MVEGFTENEYDFIKKFIDNEKNVSSEKIETLENTNEKLVNANKDQFFDINGESDEFNNILYNVIFENYDELDFKKENKYELLKYYLIEKQEFKILFYKNYLSHLEKSLFVENNKTLIGTNDEINYVVDKILESTNDIRTDDKKRIRKQFKAYFSRKIYKL